MVDRLESTCLRIEVAQIVLHESHEPDVVGDPFDAAAGPANGRKICTYR